MKLSFPSNDPAGGAAVKVEVVASEGGRSLAMVNGRPLHIAGEYQPGQQVDGRLAATEGGFKIIAADNSSGVSAEKLLQNAGLHESGPQLAAAMKSYGVPITGENLRMAAELIRQLPEGAANTELVALLLARKLPVAAAPLLLSYLSGQLKLSALFAALDKPAQTLLQNSWGQGKLLETLLTMIREGGGGNAETVRRLAGGVEEWVAGLQLQELFSQASDGPHEGKIYFQWPIFWHDQDVPDTLEGEAFVPGGSDKEQGFSLRVLVHPPALGQVEVAMNQLQRDLWVHFGVEAEMIEVFKTIFADVRERVLAGGDYDQVRITIGKTRLLNNFFSTRIETEPVLRPQKLDIKV